jgi:hypothetical protein
MLRFKILAADRGSIPLALMITLVAAMLGILVVGNTLAGQRATRFDRSYTVVLQSADAGIEEVNFRLNKQLFPTGATSMSGSGVADGIPYSWTASRPTWISTDWTAVSTSTMRDGTTRTVRSVFRDRPLFNTALATDRAIAFTGANGADSYNSATGAPTHCTWGDAGCSSGNGIIASNGNIRIPSNGYADQVLVYDWFANPGSEADPRCHDNTATGTGTDYCAAPYRENVDEPLDLRTYVDVVNEELSTCATVHDVWRASDVASHQNAIVEFPFDGGKHCFNRLILNRQIVLRPNVTGTNPLRLYVTEYIELSAGGPINCWGPGGTNQPCTNNNWRKPVARRLQIFTPAVTALVGTTETDAVKISQQTKFAGAIYAPQAKCGNLGSSNAGVDIYGTMICEEVRNNGGWNFHYDEDLMYAQTTGLYDMVSWNEE